MTAQYIMVVDDEPDIRQLVSEILEDEGYRVVVAENAERAREMHRSRKPDLVLLDIWMPGQDGISLLKEWRENNALCCPVIMMSGHGTIETAVEATKLGAYDFIEKPLSLAKMLLTISNALRTSQLEQENRGLRKQMVGIQEPIGSSAELLKRIRTAPPLLFVLGNADLLNDPQIAVVGTRNPTQGGKDNARAFAAHFAANGLTVTSGLAVGVDAYAHEAALDNGGHTLAVVGNGLDIIYPLRNRRLAERMVANGAIVSEFPIGTAALPQHFPRRNRIISGMSFGALIVEAALQSGTLTTARHAMEQGREVFAIPGSIHNPLARGCHHLIKQGAKLVETANDILEEIAPQLTAYLQQDSQPSRSVVPTLLSAEDCTSELDPDYACVLNTLGHEPLPIDQIILNTGLTAEAVSSILLMLELQGFVAACGGGHYMRLGPGNGN